MIARISSREYHWSLLSERKKKPSSTGTPSRGRLVAPRGQVGLDHEVLAVLDDHRAAALLRADHLLVQLLAGPQADVVHRRAGGDRLGEVGHLHRRDPRDQQLAALHHVEGVHDHLHGLRQRDEEPGAAQVGDRERLARLGEPGEERDHRAAAAHDVAVADHREPGVVRRGVVVAGDEQLVGGQLRGAVQVDRAGRLVGGERDHLLHAGVDGGLDDVLAAHDVGLDELERVVLRGVDLLERRGVHDVVDVVHRAQQPALVADVADEPAQARVVAEQLPDLVLLELVAGEDDQSLAGPGASARG